jgi:FkbH-like protein
VKPFLSFIGGCEFLYLIQELQSNPHKYFEFDSFFSYEQSQATNAYRYIQEHQNQIIEQKPDVIIFSQLDELIGCIQQIQFNQVDSRQNQQRQLSQLTHRCEEIIDRLSKLSIPVILQYYPWLRTRMLNNFKSNPEVYNEAQFLRQYVTAMEDLAAKYPDFYFMDLSHICSYYGYLEVFKMKDPPWHTHIIEPAVYIAEEFTRWINYVLRRDKKVKCVLVDLDNTMWKGVIRDDGIEQLEIRLDVERFRWNVLRILFSRGVMIGIISKNDDYLQEDIKSFIEPYLNGMKFVCFELSWDDKWQAVKKVREQLNIGLDSILFIDDSDFERAQIKAMLPEVRVCDENIFEELLYLPELQPEFVTTESSKRTDYYIREDQRKAAAQNISTEQFLKQCCFKIKVKQMEPFELNRVTELVQRTNQLNTSIKRYTKNEIIKLSEDIDCDIFTVYVSDNFGDYGLVGVCIGFNRNVTYRIDTLLFSCRIMSRGVEDYVLSAILTWAKQRGFSRVTAQFKKGKKNAGMQQILVNNYFTESESQGRLLYSFDDLQDRQIKPLPEWFSPMESSDEKAEVVI